MAGSRVHYISEANDSDRSIHKTRSRCEEARDREIAGNASRMFHPVRKFQNLELLVEVEMQAKTSDPAQSPKAMLCHSIAIASRAARLRDDGAKREAKKVFHAAAEMAEDGLKIAMHPPLIGDRVQIISLLILHVARCLAACGQYEKALAYCAQVQILRLDTSASIELQKLSTQILGRHRKVS